MQILIGTIVYYGDCKEKIVKTVEKHKAVAIPAVKATCTKSGLTAGTKCSVCGYVIKNAAE